MCKNRQNIYEISSSVTIIKKEILTKAVELLSHYFLCLCAEWWRWSAIGANSNIQHSTTVVMVLGKFVHIVIRVIATMVHFGVVEMTMTIAVIVIGIERGWWCIDLMCSDDFCPLWGQYDGILVLGWVEEVGIGVGITWSRTYFADPIRWCKIIGINGISWSAWGGNIKCCGGKSVCKNNTETLILMWFQFSQNVLECSIFSLFYRACSCASMYQHYERRPSGVRWKNIFIEHRRSLAETHRKWRSVRNQEEKDNKNMIKFS